MDYARDVQEAGVSQHLTTSRLLVISLDTLTLVFSAMDGMEICKIYQASLHVRCSLSSSRLRPASDQ